VEPPKGEARDREDRLGGFPRPFLRGGTGGPNPVPSSEESIANSIPFVERAQHSSEIGATRRLEEFSCATPRSHFVDRALL
jgi:hypothetical protein